MTSDLLYEIRDQRIKDFESWYRKAFEECVVYKKLKNQFLTHRTQF